MSRQNPRQTNARLPNRTDQRSIWVGSFCQDGSRARGRYYPDSDIVRVSFDGESDTHEVAARGWTRHLTTPGDMLTYEGRRRRHLFEQGKLIHQPDCAHKTCDEVVIPHWVTRNAQTPDEIATGVYCMNHLTDRCLEACDTDGIHLIYPWQDLTDELRQQVAMFGLDAFEDPGGVLDPLSDT